MHFYSGQYISSELIYYYYFTNVERFSLSLKLKFCFTILNLNLALKFSISIVRSLQRLCLGHILDNRVYLSNHLSAHSTFMKISFLFLRTNSFRGMEFSEMQKLVTEPQKKFQKNSEMILDIQLYQTMSSEAQ